MGSLLSSLGRAISVPLSLGAYGYAMWALAINAAAFLMNIGHFKSVKIVDSFIVKFEQFVFKSDL